MSDEKAFRKAQMEKFADLLEDAVRDVKPDAEFSWRHMFGGAGYYADGVMFAGLYDSHTIGLKLDAEDYEALLAVDGAEEGFGKHTINLPVAMLDNQPELNKWVKKGLDFAASRPPKKKKKKSKK